jgi:predicted permease
VTLAQATADVNAHLPGLAAAAPRLYSGTHATVVGVQQQLVGRVRPALWLLLAAVALVLIVACANVVNLLIARNSARSREIGIRVALGASKGRLLRQSIAETGLTVMAGGAAAVLTAKGILDLFRWFEPAGLPRFDAVRIDSPVLVFTLVVLVATALLVGSAPVTAIGDAVSSIRSAGSGVTASLNRRRLGSGLVIVQLAACTMLLAGAGQLGRGLVRLTTVDLGIRPDHVAAASVTLTFRQSVDDAGKIALVERIEQQIRALPGIRSVGAGTSLPPNDNNIRLTLRRAGGDAFDYQAVAVAATPGYFPALGVQLLRGRLFTAADDSSREPVMIMTAETARRFFSQADPIGQTMTVPVLRDGRNATVEAKLVGIISNVKYSGLESSASDVVSPFRHRIATRQRGWGPHSASSGGERRHQRGRSRPARTTQSGGPTLQDECSSDPFEKPWRIVRFEIFFKDRPAVRVTHSDVA